MKFLAIILGLSAATCAQRISIMSISNKGIPLTVMPGNCLQVNAQRECVLCVKNFEVKDGKCAPVVAPIFQNSDLEETFSQQLSPNFLPCRGADFCGEAQTFKSEADFNNLVDQFSPQQRYFNNDQFRVIADNSMPIFGQQNMIMGNRNVLIGSSLNGAAVSGNLKYQSAPQFQRPSASQSRDFSGTNNQVKNVDEADLLKTDGTYIYTISDSKLSITLAYPAYNARVECQLEITQLTPEALFIQGNYLSVFGTQDSNGDAYTKIRIYDISNKAKPFLARTFKVAGRYTNGRKTEDGFVYLVANQQINRKYRPWYDYGSGRQQLVWSSIYRYPITYSRPQLTNIIAFNLANPTSSEKKIISICGQSSEIMYMAERSIYLTSTNYDSQKGDTYTTIRKVFVRKNRIIPFADGKIRGTLNNQFSLDEYGPYLRVAATLNKNGQNSNSVYTLGYYMRPYGQLSNIAPGERIFSARYVNKRLYLVTFRQVDPFFVISLANHKRPKILGELKVPGFSRYLHPYDEETIIGFGRQADSNGRQEGLKVSLFDVSDVKQPKELAKMEVEEKYANSKAEWEHKAFLFSLEKNMMVIPTSINHSNDKFNGALAIHISKQDKEIVPKAAIDHLLSEDDEFSRRDVERSLYIEDMLYTKSKCLIRINKISEYFQGVKDITLPCSQPVNNISYKYRQRQDIQPVVSDIVFGDQIRPIPSITPGWQFGGTLDLQDFIRKPVRDENIVIGTPVAPGREFGATLDLQDFIRKPVRDENIVIGTPVAPGREFGATLDLQDFIRKPVRDENIVIGTPVAPGREFGATLDLQDFIRKPVRDENIVIGTPVAPGREFGATLDLQDFIRKPVRDENIVIGTPMGQPFDTNNLFRLFDIHGIIAKQGRI